MRKNGRFTVIECEKQHRPRQLGISGCSFTWKIYWAARWTWLQKKHYVRSYALFLSKRPFMFEREWRFYLDDMIGFAEKVMAYTDGLAQAEFVASGLNYDAALRISRHYCLSYTN